MLNTQSDSKNLGICLQKPSYRNYTTMASRVKSFQSWTKTSPRPVDLAEAGFFFTGSEDIVQCYYCGLRLRRWDVFDSPWIEHARHGKDCPHVYNVKGGEFCKSFCETPKDGGSINHCIIKFEEQPLYTDDLIHTTAAQALVSMGYYTEQDIRNAIKLYVTEKGNQQKVGVAADVKVNWNFLPVTLQNFSRTVTYTDKTPLVGTRLQVNGKLTSGIYMYG